MRAALRCSLLNRRIRPQRTTSLERWILGSSAKARSPSHNCKRIQPSKEWEATISTGRGASIIISKAIAAWKTRPLISTKNSSRPKKECWQWLMSAQMNPVTRSPSTLMTARKAAARAPWPNQKSTNSWCPIEAVSPRNPSSSWLTPNSASS